MKRYPAEVLSRHEIESLLAACGTESWTDRRNHALIMLLWRTGRVRALALAAWMDEHRAMGLGAVGPLFMTGSGRAVSQGYLRRRLPELARLAGIHKRVHAQGLRHTHASELRAELIDIAVIRRQLGHASLLTTVEYLDHLEPESVLRFIMSRRVCG